MSPAAQNALHQSLWAIGIAVLLCSACAGSKGQPLSRPPPWKATPRAWPASKRSQEPDGESFSAGSWTTALKPRDGREMATAGISVRLDKLLIFRGGRVRHALRLPRLRPEHRQPGEEGTYRDADAVYKWLAARDVAPGRIVFYGESLGGAVAMESSLRHACGGLVLDSAFTSTVEMGKRLFPMLPVSWFVRFRYDNRSKIPRVRVPVLVMHSIQDDIVPFDMGRALFDAAPEPKTFFEMKGGHNDGFLETGPAYGEAIRSFLASLGRPASSAGAVRPLAGRRPWSSAERAGRKVRP